MRGSIAKAVGFGAQIISIAVASSVIALSPVTARAQSYWDLEHARANARAGGPISEQDAELLERYGCLSGTRSTFCDKLSGKSRYQNKKARQRTERRLRKND